MLLSWYGTIATMMASVPLLAASVMLQPGMPPGGRGDCGEAISLDPARYAVVPSAAIDHARKALFSPPTKCITPWTADENSSGVPCRCRVAPPGNRFNCIGEAGAG